MLLENCAATLLKNLFSGLGIYSSPLISASEVWGGGQEIDGQRDTHRWFQLGFLFPTRSPYSEQGLQSLQYFVTGEDE